MLAKMIDRIVSLKQTQTFDIGHSHYCLNLNIGTQKRGWIYSKNISRITFCH